MQPFSRFPFQTLTYANPDAVRLLRTDFRSTIALGSPTLLGGGTQGRWFPTGVDSASGDNIATSLNGYFGAKTSMFIQALPTAAVADEAALNAVMTAEIQSTTLSSDTDARELVLTLIQRNDSPGYTGNPQISLQWLRLRDDYPTNAIPMVDLPSIYWAFDTVLDPNLNNLPTTAGNYADLSSFKTGDLPNPYPSGAISSSVGTFRINALLQKNSDGDLYISCNVDNVANSIGIVPTGTNPQTGFYFAPFVLSSRQVNVGDTVKGKTTGTTGTVQYADLRVNSWGSSGKGALIITNDGAAFNQSEVLQIQVAGVWTDACTLNGCWNGYESRQLSNEEDKYHSIRAMVGTVPIGTPIRLEFYYKKPVGGRTDTMTGITRMWLTNKSTGVRTQLCNFVGGIQYGALNDPITRFIPAITYTNLGNGGAPINVVSRVANLEVWTDYPYA